MYNQEIKERYLATKSSRTAENAKALLVVSAKFEERFHKDISEFTKNEFAEFIEGFGFLEPDTIRNRLAIISAYKKWYEKAFDKHIDAPPYTVLDYPYAKYFDATLTKSPDELIQKITSVYDVDSGQPVIAILCLAWLGLDVQEVLNLKVEQVDTWNGVITNLEHDACICEMDLAVREVLDIYSKTHSATRVRHFEYTVYADNIGFFVKRMLETNSNLYGKPISAKDIKSWTTVLKNSYAEKYGTEAATSITYSNVQRSGNFYRLHQLAQSGVDVRKLKNSDKVRMCLGKSKRNHKDNMIMYDAYLKCIGEK